MLDSYQLKAASDIKHFFPSPSSSRFLDFVFVIFFSGDTFTYNEFRNNVFYYTHIVSALEAEFDLLWFTISDGAHKTGAAVTIKVDPQSRNGVDDPSDPDEEDPYTDPGQGGGGNTPLQKDPDASFDLTVSAGMTQNIWHEFHANM